MTVQVRANLTIPSGDGTPLATDVYLPGAEVTPRVVVVTRTPYGRSAHLREGMGWAARGYAFVVQDVRGRGDSAGDWHPYTSERGDGDALARWILAQPWGASGYVARGHSYAAHTAWTMALSTAAPARAVISHAPAVGIRRVKFGTTGNLRLAEHLAWWLEHGDSRTSRPGLWEAMCAHDPGFLAHLPVVDIGDRLWADLPGWRAIVETPERADGGALADEELPGLAIPSLHVGGWYDPLGIEALRLWRLAGSAHPAPAPKHLVLGPWGHDLGANGTGRVHDTQHGPSSQLPLGEFEVQWLGEALAAVPAAGDRVRAYLIGGDKWLEAAQWPPADIVSRRWMPGADGGLSEDEPEPGEVVFRSQPDNPFPSVPRGKDRSSLSVRIDSAAFASTPFAHEIDIVGSPVAWLDVHSTAPASDWSVRLIEQTQSGVQQEITAEYSHDGPGTVSGRVRVPLPPVAYRVQRGSRLVLEIAGSDFPFYARNLGTGEDRYRGTTTAAVCQSVRCGPDRTEFLLPVTVPPV